MADNGWISIHRKITRNWIWEGKPFSYGQAWIDILLECNHAERKQLIKKKLVKTTRGQSSNSRQTWATRWGWSKSAVDHFLKLLELDGMIQTENIHVTTRLTVLNYDTYQRQTNAGDTAEEPQGIPHEDRRAYTNNNVNNGNNDNNGVLGAHTAFINISSKKPTNHELLQITNLCHQYTAIVVIEAITVMGDHGWHSIGTLKKVLTGELPKVNEEGDGVDKRYLV